MFTDELAGNPAKKRADEAKARRFRAKREKEAKVFRKRKELERRNQEAAAADLAAVDGESSAGDIAPKNDAVGLPPPLSSSASSSTGGPKEKNAKAIPTAAADPSPAAAPLTAAQKATDQRKLRAEARARMSAATSLQSIIRSKLISAKAREDQRSIFDKRMSDLIALAGILKQSTKTEYVPPPATVSMMTTQFLFFACPTTVRKNHPSGEIMLNSGSMVMEERDLSRWAKLVKNLLLPGVLSDNLDLDPLMPWMQSAGGTTRLHRVMKLCVSSISAKHAQPRKRIGKAIPSPTKSSIKGNTTTDNCYSAVDLFLRTILRLSTSKDMDGDGPGQYRGGSSRDVVYQKSRSILLQSATPKIMGSVAASQKDHRNEPCSCDLVSSLRALLLFGSTGNNPPIPGDAGSLRENCVTNDERERASLLLRLVVDLIASLENLGTEQMTLNCLCSRFLSEVMTVPILTWKVAPSAYGRLVNQQSKKGSKTKIPPLVLYIHRFINWNADKVSCGSVESLLDMADVSLTSCPAPAVLCLLANMIQIGRTCEAINGINPTVLHYKASAEYFNFLATLLNSAPLGTFSSRMSAVEWVSIGSSSTPIVLSDVVIEQASAILSDSYVRALFTCAINDEELGTETVINTKTDKDKKHEKDLEDIGTSSASTVAAKEAMTDRNRSFWQSSKWAKKLTSLISGSGEKMKPSKSGISSKGVGKLMNTSSISRSLANGKGPINRAVTNAVLSSKSTTDKEIKDCNVKKEHQEYSILFLLSLCRVYGTIISRWGGNGKEDLVKRAQQSLDSTKPGKEHASATVEPCVTALLNVLSFSTSFVVSSWAIIQSNPRAVSDLYEVIDVNKRGAPIRTLSTLPTYKQLRHLNYGAGDGNAGAVVLLMFVTCLSHTLIVTDDVEIHDAEKPIPKHQLRRCILLLKKLLYRACCLDDIHEATKSKQAMDSSHFGLSLISTSSKALADLYGRSSRRFLCVPKFWIEEGLLEQDLRRCKTHNDYTLLLSKPVCRICPFLISFKRRLKLFERIITTNRIDIQGSNEQRNLKPGIMVKVNRGRVLEDGLAHLNKLGRDMRHRLVVCYLSEAGARETGIDVGGLFKEFWTDLSNLAFDPNYVLFKTTEDSLMYPNPSSKIAHSDHIVLFEFLGRILGKALYEGITIQPQFAHLFLSFLRGDHSYLHLLTDLSTIDSQLYTNLMFLKSYEGDASDLCLSFTVANDDFGVSEVPLIANGANIEVTNANKCRYIYLVAKHHVSDRIKDQSDAFTRGLWDVIDRSWLKLFNEPELQVLISGASDGKIDVSDMKSNTRYVGGYTMLDRNVVRFWNVVSTFSPKHQADLLRFVTSCERPPPLGFASMNPPFTIQRVGIMRDSEKLPSAATCFNTLKLPTYSSEKVLREKLTFAIGSGAGFELT